MTPIHIFMMPSSTKSLSNISVNWFCLSLCVCVWLLNFCLQCSKNVKIKAQSSMLNCNDLILYFLSEQFFQHLFIIYDRKKHYKTLKQSGKRLLVGAIFIFQVVFFVFVGERGVIIRQLPLMILVMVYQVYFP